MPAGRITGGGKPMIVRKWFTVFSTGLAFLGLFLFLSAMMSPPAKAEHYLRKNGTIVASIDGKYFRSNGSIVGEYDGSYVRRNGSIIGQIDDCYIRSNGSIIGQIDGDYLRSNGSILYEIDHNGYVRKNGSIYLQIDGYTPALKKAVAAYLFFFD